MGTGLMPEDKLERQCISTATNWLFNDTQRDAIKGAEVYSGLKAGFVGGQAISPVLCS